MSIEQSHGKARVMRPRLRDVAAAAAGDEPRRDRDERGRFAAGNTAGRNRTAKRSLTAALRTAVAAGLAGVVAAQDSAAPAASQLAQQALELYRAGRRDLRTHSPLALSALRTWAVNTAIASHLSMLAAEHGLDSDRGLRLLERAHMCEGRAERASIAALDVAGALRRRGNEPEDVHGRVAAAFGPKPGGAP